MYYAFLLFAYTANKRANLGYFRHYSETYFFSYKIGYILGRILAVLLV